MFIDFVLFLEKVLECFVGFFLSFYSFVLESKISNYVNLVSE